MATLISKLIKLNKQYNIDILGELPTGCVAICVVDVHNYTSIDVNDDYIAMYMFLCVHTQLGK